MQARFRLVMPGGDGDNQITWELTGHLWQEEPYTDASTRIGHNPKSNTIGTLTGYGAASAYDVVLADTAGTTPSGGRGRSRDSSIAHGRRTSSRGARGASSVSRPG